MGPEEIKGEIGVYYNKVDNKKEIFEENKHKISKVQWNKWSITQQIFFNKSYEYICDNQNVLNGLNALDKGIWSVIAWNITFMLTNDFIKKEI